MRGRCTPIRRRNEPREESFCDGTAVAGIWRHIAGLSDIMIDWFVHTLRTYPEIAIFLSLALGYYFGSFTYKGLGLGVVTASLIAAVIIGQIGITISGPLKPTFFLMFLFAIGYGVGP